jgi:hypothetical protein
MKNETKKRGRPSSKKVGDKIKESRNKKYSLNEDEENLKSNLT